MSPNITINYTLSGSNIIITRNGAGVVMNETDIRDALARVMAHRADYASDEAWRAELAVCTGALDFGLINVWRKRK